jgi:hypothetical protein
MGKLWLTVIAMIAWFMAGVYRGAQGELTDGTSSASLVSPAPAASGGQQPAGGQGSETPPSSSQPAAPSLPPLSGVEGFTLQHEGETRNYFLPSFEYAGIADTNALETVGHHRTNFASALILNLDLQQVKRTSQFNLDYIGGEQLYTYPLTFGTPQESRFAFGYHSLNLAEQVWLRRWSFAFLDRLSYLPEAWFGFGGFAGLDTSEGGVGTGLGGGTFGATPILASGLISNETILTGRTRTFGNLATAEVGYKASARSDFTLAGGIGNFQYIDSGLLDSNYWFLLAGYNHRLTRRDEIGIIYLDVLLTFHGINNERLVRGFELAYGRQVTNRLALKLAAGPLASSFAKPLGGSVTKGLWSTEDSLEYRLRQSVLTASFTRMVTNGGGVLLGAETSLFTVGINCPLRRRVDGSLNFGYAYNQSLTPLASSTYPAKFATYTAIASISRQWGKHMSLFITYTVDRQASNTPISFSNGAPGAIFWRQMGTIGINVHRRPGLLEAGMPANRSH